MNDETGGRYRKIALISAPVRNRKIDFNVQAMMDEMDLAAAKKVMDQEIVMK